MTSDQEQALADGVQALKLVKELSARVDKLEGTPAAPVEEPVAAPPVAMDVAPEQ